MHNYDTMRGMHNYYGQPDPLYDREGDRVGTDEDFPTERELDTVFMAELDETHGVVTIAGYEFDPSLALRGLDPTAYREVFLDWLDANYMELYDYEGNETDYYERKG